MMAKVVVLLCAACLAACAVDSERGASPAPCSPQWFEFVEDVVPTGDAEGHGPDTGSSEWRSVVEFKLGIRGDPAIPDRATGEWCRYIDKVLVDKGVHR
jgi:hypothetical protein